MQSIEINIFYMFYLLITFLFCNYFRHFKIQKFARTLCLSFMDPLPNTAILHMVSSCSLLSEFPLGPSSLPTKLNWNQKENKTVQQRDIVSFLRWSASREYKARCAAINHPETVGERGKGKKSRCHIGRRRSDLYWFCLWERTRDYLSFCGEGEKSRRDAAYDIGCHIKQGDGKKVNLFLSFRVWEEK